MTVRFLSRRMIFLIPSLVKAVLVIDKDSLLRIVARMQDLLSHCHSDHF
jgi:hypothetical protein